MHYSTDEQIKYLVPESADRHGIVLPAGNSKSKINSIMLVFATYPPYRDGGADYTYLLAHQLAERGVAVTVLTSPHPGQDHEVLEENRPGARVRVRRTIHDWRVSGQLRAQVARLHAECREVQPELVHLIYPSSVVANSYQLPALLKPTLNLPLVTTFFNFNLVRGSTFFTKLTSLALLLSSDVLTTHDDYYLSWLHRLLPHRHDRIRFTPIGSNLSHELGAWDLDTGSAKHSAGLDPTQVYLAYFGGVDRSRGLEDLFSALASLAQHIPVRLLMLGQEEGIVAQSEYGRNLLRLALQLGVQEKLSWTGYLPALKLGALLRCCEVCVLPFRRNALGRTSLAAALQAGMPIITSSAASRILVNGKHAWLVPPRRPDLLTSAIGTVCGSREIRRTLSTGAREAGRYFDWHNVSNAVISAYNLTVE